RPSSLHRHDDQLNSGANATSADHLAVILRIASPKLSCHCIWLPRRRHQGEANCAGSTAVRRKTRDAASGSQLGRIQDKTSRPAASSTILAPNLRLSRSSVCCSHSTSRLDGRASRKLRIWSGSISRLTTAALAASTPAKYIKAKSPRYSS